MSPQSQENFRYDYRLPPSQWEMLQIDVVSQWLGANFESVLIFHGMCASTRKTMNFNIWPKCQNKSLDYHIENDKLLNASYVAWIQVLCAGNVHAMLCRGCSYLQLLFSATSGTIAIAARVLTWLQSPVMDCLTVYKAREEAFISRAGI